MNISTMLSCYIEEHGISQRELARRAGLSATAITYIISGKPNKDGTRQPPAIPDTITIKKLASAMNLSVDEFTACINDDEIIEVNKISPARARAIEIIYSLSEAEIFSFLTLFDKKGNGERK